MLTLYFAPGSSSMAPHIALNEIGVPFEAKPVSFAKKEPQSAAYRATNPEGKVPALLIDGRLMTEVAAILYYLARKHPEAKLFPAGDVEAEAQVISWMSFTAATLHPARQIGPERTQLVYTEANRRLGANEWAVGGLYSIADIHLFRLYWRYRGGLDAPPEFPNLERHYARMMSRPAVMKTIAAETAVGYELPK